MEQALYSEMDALEHSHWWFVGRRKIIFDLLRRRCGQGREVLDIGVGTGLTAALLLARGYKVTGVEPSKDAVALARAKAPQLHIIETSFPSPQIPQGSFDVVLMLDVIEHLEDDLGALSAVYRALRPGGTVLITTPAYRFLWSGHDELAHHYRRYRRYELMQKLQRAGLVPHFVSYYNFFLFPPIALVRLVTNLLGIKKTESDFSATPSFLNAPLSAIFGMERFLLRLTPLPFGVSLIAIAKKPV